MFIFKKKINFYDCDPAGIFFYARVYELCHSAYESLVESFNLEEDYWRNKDYVVPIIHSEAFYHKPVKYGDEIEIRVTVTQLKSFSFELSYECLNQKGERCAKVKTAHVFVDKENWKKKNIIEKVREGLTKHLAAI